MIKVLMWNYTNDIGEEELEITAASCRLLKIARRVRACVYVCMNWRGRAIACVRFVCVCVSLAVRSIRSWDFVITHRFDPISNGYCICHGVGV